MSSSTSLDQLGRDLAVVAITHAQSCQSSHCLYPGCREWNPAMARLVRCRCSLQGPYQVLMDAASCRSCKEVVRVLLDHAHGCARTDCSMFMCQELHEFVIPNRQPPDDATEARTGAKKRKPPKRPKRRRGSDTENSGTVPDPPTP